MADQIEWICDDIVPDCKFPGDVMVSILTYLPVKSLMKFKAVSKPWCSFISSPRFFKLHLRQQSVGSAKDCLMVFTDRKFDLLKERKFGLLNLYHNFDNNHIDDDVLMLEIPPLLLPDIGVVDTCNGVVCLFGLSAVYRGFILWNPATRKYRFIGRPEVDKDDALLCRTLGFCYVDATSDFKILALYESPVDTYLYVYSLNSNSWDKMDFNASSIVVDDFERPCFVGRCMHWLSFTCFNGPECTCSSVSEMVAFDVMDGTMSLFKVPVNRGHHYERLIHTLVIGGCLSIVILRDSIAGDVDPKEQGIEVWVMEEYGVQGSWVKRFFIQDEFTQLRSRVKRVFIQEEFRQSRLPISWIHGEIVLNCNYDESRVLISYDPYNKKTKKIEFKSFDVLYLFSYVESLASVETICDGGLDI